MPGWTSQRLWRLVDPPALRFFARRLLGPNTRLALRLCLPAAVVAIALRAVLLADQPAAFLHNDTVSALETADRLLSRGSLAIDGKKTFLAPLLYCVPALLHLPVLPFVAVVQHLLGVATVFVVGLLTFAWLRHWRWLIVPVTLLLALNPVLLWYEHAALAETFTVFGVLLVALAATLFFRMPNRYSLTLLGAALLFLAGARPEGRLFALFAIVLVARVLWGNWRAFRVGVPLVVAWMILIFALTRTSQSGLLLFTSVLHLTPPQLVFSPDVAETVRPLADEARAQWANRTPKLVPLRKNLQRTLEAADLDADEVGKRAGLEIAFRRLPALPSLAVEKFVIAHREFPSGDFTAYPQAAQLHALTNGAPDKPQDRALRYARLLWGRPLASPAEAEAFLLETYRPLPVLTRWLEAWQSFAIRPLASLSLPGSDVARVSIQGLPWLYATAVLGLVCLAFRPALPPLGFHQLWGAFLLGLFVLIMVTANIRARFRVIFEPFWILYAAALLDTLLIVAARWWPRRSA